jgi:hypothetical protein
MDLTEFLASIVRSIVESLRRNKLPAFLSLIAVLVTTTLAVTSDYDERPRYRKFVLPAINKAESQFVDVMNLAETENTEPRRTLYFLEAHRRAKNALKVIQSERPMTSAGRKAQAELARYYELVDEQLAIIRTEMSNSESYDYIAEWNRKNAQLKPIRERWLIWLNARSQ